MPTRTDFSKLCPIFADAPLGSQNEITFEKIHTTLSLTTQQKPYKFKRPIDVIGAVAFRHIPATGASTGALAKSTSSKIGLYTDSTAVEGSIFGSISIDASMDFSMYASGDILSTRFSTDAKMFFKMVEKGSHNASLSFMTVVVRYRDA